MMEQERPLDRRNRRWGSLRDAVKLRVRLSKRAKEILSALRNCDEEQVSYGAVIEKLIKRHARSLAREKTKETPKQAASFESRHKERELKTAQPQQKN